MFDRIESLLLIAESLVDRHKSSQSSLEAGIVRQTTAITQPIDAENGFEVPQSISQLCEAVLKPTNTRQPEVKSRERRGEPYVETHSTNIERHSASVAQR